MNQKGFALISMTVALPLVFIICISGLWLVWFMNQKKGLHNMCHHHLLKAQDYLVRGNTDLLRLNPIAKALIFQKRTLDAIILFAPPPAKATALIQRRFVVAEQQFLKKTQQGIIGFANIMANKELLKYQMAYRRKMRELNRLWKSQSSIPSFLEAYPKISQVKVDWPDIAPTYKRGSSHEKIQRFKARWKVPIRNAMPDWLLNYVPVSELWLGECATHPHKGVSQWNAAIGEGNH